MIINSSLAAYDTVDMIYTCLEHVERDKNITDSLGEVCLDYLVAKSKGFLFFLVCFYINSCFG